MIIAKKITINILQILIYLLPITFILGNLIINIFVLIISILGGLYFKKNLLDFKDKKILYLMSSFFLLLLFSTLFELFVHGFYPDWIKAILYLRFFLLLLVIKALVSNGLLNLNYFLSSCFFISGFVSIDIIIQFLLGQNILGYSPVTTRGGIQYFSGIFGEELVAGGYVLMFSIIGIFSIPFLFKGNKKISLSIIFLIITVIIFLSLLLAGNRMPTLMFIFSLILFSLLIKKKKYKYHFFFIGTVLLLIGTFTLFKSETFQNRYSSFLKGIPNPIHLIKEIQKDYPELEKYKNSGKQFHTYKEYNAEENYELFPHYTGHFPLYLTSLSLFIDDPIFGKGIKSFRNNCIKKVYLPNRVCESHPHNFILEILNDTGVLGLFFIFIPIFFVLFNLYREYLIGDKRNNSISNWVYIAIILAIIVQIFPLRSSGSFFSTFNSAYTFLLLGISLGLNEIRFKNINK